MVNIVDELISFIKDASLTQEKAADLLGISQPFLSQVLSGKRSVDSSTEQMMRFAMTKVRQGSLLSNAQIVSLESEGFRRVPVISMAKAGKATDYEDMMDFIEEYSLTQTKDPNAFALIVEGDSMEKSYLAGDFIVCSPNAVPRNGKPVVARLRDGAATAPNTGGVLFKRDQQKGPNGEIIRLESDNPNYEPLEFKKEDFWFIYPVVTMTRKER
jgi:SOS-response transcriptional repressor LexA